VTVVFGFDSIADRFKASRGALAVAFMLFAVEGGAVEPDVPEPRFKVETLRFTVVDFAAPMEVTTRALRFRLPSDVLFGFGQDRPRPEAAALLERLAANIRRQYPTATIRVEGYTDSKGSARTNLRVAERRALAVKEWLQSQGGLVHARFLTRSFGESQALMPNQNADGTDNPMGRQQNRRIEIVVERI
jgi:outer membrane protein OmpA-like peptidoglycan-associated protein